MKLTAGEIYFIRETDKLTKTESSYIKIGLIREGEDRTSEDRALEHQTGNPRELHVFEKVQTHAVSEVENILHHFYANSRVSGEWFNLTPDLLTEAIGKARELAATATKNINALERAEALKLTVSTEDVILPTESIKKWHSQVLGANVQIKRCDELSKLMIEVAVAAADREEEVSHIVTVQDRRPSERFDSDAFKLKYPSIWAEFQKSKDSIKQRFTISGAKEFTLEVKDLNPELFELGVKFEELVKKVNEKNASIEELHREKLKLLGIKAALEWDKEIAEANLKSSCNTAKEIEGICKWARLLETKISLDEKSLRAAHAEKVQEFVTLVDVAPAIIIEPRRGYANEAESNE